MPASSSASTISLTSSASAQAQPRKLPITSIPDMRFEQSFLASVRGFIHEIEAEAAEEMKKEKRHPHDQQGEKEDKGSSILSTKSPTGEPELWLGRLRIEWWPLLYLTIRDQILSPIVQGAVFGVGGLALSHLRAYLVARRRASAASTTG